MNRPHDEAVVAFMDADHRLDVRVVDYNATPDHLAVTQAGNPLPQIGAAQGDTWLPGGARRSTRCCSPPGGARGTGTSYASSSSGPGHGLAGRADDDALTERQFESERIGGERARGPALAALRNCSTGNSNPCLGL